MPAEHSSGAIVFRKEGDKVFYLLLHYEEGHWGSPKGHIENNETIEETASREIREATGLTDIRFLDGFKEHNHYFFSSQHQRVFKTVTFLLAETFSKEIRVSWEHTGFTWLTFPEVLEKVTFDDEKKLFQKAQQLISGKNS
jgi:bis(5'-nucleosidyl)-tetraphosphatase